jgi:hypothetical protein
VINMVANLQELLSSEMAVVASVQLRADSSFPIDIASLAALAELGVQILYANSPMRFAMTGTCLCGRMPAASVELFASSKCF